MRRPTVHASIKRMWIRDQSGRWLFSRRTAMRVLRLDGNGALRPRRIKGLLQIERGGVCITAYPSVQPESRRSSRVITRLPSLINENPR